MKIRVFSHSDYQGGAAIAAYRLTEALRHTNPNVYMTVFDKYKNDPYIEKISHRISNTFSRFSYGIDHVPLRKYPHRDKSSAWSTNWFPYHGILGLQDADVLHFHWVGSGLMPIARVSKIKQPIVWTMHDEWAYTGGCHYTAGCSRFENTCGACPQLASQREHDLSRSIWNNKNKSWKNVSLTLVAPSRWLGERARRSSLFAGRDIRVIPNGLDLKTYRPVEKKIARQLLQISEDKRIILFGASNSTSDPRKGFLKLLEALQKISLDLSTSDTQLVVFGASKNEEADKLGFPIHYVGTLRDDLMLALLYSAADVFVAPSMQDNLPNTIMESLACGTPVVGFDVGGIPDLVEHQANGYLAASGSADDLAKGIAWVLEDRERWQNLSARARQKCEQEFEISLVARRYTNLYEEVTAKA